MIATPPLPQSRADSLIAMPKRRISDTVWDYPVGGSSVAIPLESMDGAESFLLDLWTSKYSLRKRTYQNRFSRAIILVRLDIHTRPHRNPDNTMIASPHIHIYKEGFGDRWAEAVPRDRFRDLDDPLKTLTDFMDFCNIVQKPSFGGHLIP